MHNSFLIARREYLERVRSKSFLFITIFIPALMFCVTALPTLIASRFSGAARHVVVVASDSRTADLIRDQLQTGADDDKEARAESGAPAARYLVDVDTNATAGERAALSLKVKDKQIDGVVWATDDALASNKITYVTRDVSNLNDTIGIRQLVGRAVHRLALKKRGLSDADIDTALKPMDMQTENPAGGAAGNPLTAFLAVFGLVMIMYMAVLLYGMNVMRAVLEEKTSRIMEVMLATATPTQMMTGKILGVGAVGLTQVAIWTVSTAILSQLAAAAAAGALKGIISLRLAFYFPIFFLLGFVLFSTMYAAVGAMVNSEQEAQQLQFLVATPLIASVIVLVQILQNPGTELGVWASIFPLTSPLVMFARIALDQTVPSWQIGLSIGLLLATIYGMMILCGRIYRVGVLMYGKKPTLPEIVKWIKYA
jgi:ABC-2 type transport system permease protein